MTNQNIIFSRILLKNAREDLKKKLSKEDYKDLMKNFWMYRYSDGSTELHINKCNLFKEGIYKVLNKTDNMYHTKAEGLMEIYHILFEEE